MNGLDQSKNSDRNAKIKQIFREKRRTDKPDQEVDESGGVVVPLFIAIFLFVAFVVLMALKFI